MNEQFNTPILFVIFNREKIACNSFDKIKAVKPSRLYIACDGPRASVEKESLKVENTRNAILSMIDWDCEVRTLFQKENIGCGLAVSSAINWLFSFEEEGIILEDDCVASKSFFLYCAELLAKYKDDSRIGMISGHNTLGRIYSEDSYCFSSNKACWGWATWKRAWCGMDYTMNWKRTPYARSIADNSGIRLKDTRYWEYRVHLIDNKYVNTWDWQWYLSLSAQNQLAVFPSVNLIMNVGVGEAATHTISLHSDFLEAKEMKFPLKHPDYVCPDSAFDKAFYKSNHTLYNAIATLIPLKVKIVLKAILKKVI